MSIIRSRWPGMVLLILLLLSTLIVFVENNFTHAKGTTGKKNTAKTATSTFLNTNNEAGYSVGNGSSHYYEISGNVTVPCIQSGTPGGTLAIAMGIGNGTNNFDIGLLDKPNGVIQPFYSDSSTNALNPKLQGGLTNYACGDTFGIVVSAGQNGTNVGYSVTDNTKATEANSYIVNTFTLHAVDTTKVEAFIARDYCPSVGPGGSYSPLTHFSTAVLWSDVVVDAGNNQNSLASFPNTQMTMVGSKTSHGVLAQTTALTPTSVKQNSTPGSSFSNNWISAGSDASAAC